jgi:hypothetical protein
LILCAIRKAEAGAPGKEFGVKHPKAWGTNLDTQAGWAAATVKKSNDRWIKAGSKGSFIEYLGKRYCPPEAHPLNEHWYNNVKVWYKRFKGLYSPEKEFNARSKS